jgi:hypothetical protein
VYRIFSLIDPLSFAPVASAEDADHFVAVSEADRQDPATDFAEAVIPPLDSAVGEVLRNDAPRVGEGELRHCEGHSMLLLVLLVLFGIPFEPGLRHGSR